MEFNCKIEFYVCDFSLSKTCYKGKQEPYTPALYDDIGKTIEKTGYSIHHIPYNESTTRPGNFNTTYQTKHCYVPKIGVITNPRLELKSRGMRNRMVGICLGARQNVGIFGGSVFLKDLLGPIKDPNR